MKKISLGLALVIGACFTVFAQSAFNPLNFVTFKKAYTYTQGEDGQAYPIERTLQPFAMNKFETSYNLWYEVRVKAEKMGYIFQNPGQAGSHGRRGAAPTEANQNQPVTMINWYDAVVWCNALSEIKGKTPCYKYKGQVLKDATDSVSLDQCECNWNADGYRLPSESEWEFCARKTKSGFQKGNLISGQKTSGTEEGLRYAWLSDNAVNTRVIGTAGLPFDPNSISMPATGNANQAGFFDMTGNVMEYCWDWFGEYNSDKPYGIDLGYERVCRGSSWSAYTLFQYTADRYSYDPNETYNYMGFRICYSIVE